MQKISRQSVAELLADRIAGLAHVPAECRPARRQEHAPGVNGAVGLDAFTGEAIADPRLLALAAKVRYQIDPENPYPNNYTGHIRAVLRDGRVVEERQPHIRGGAREPLSRQDIEEKFRLNVRHGGWDAARADAAIALARRLFDGPLELGALLG
jgi:2-methylcitrate dehydratase PrpD